MASAQTASEILENTYLEIRAKLLEVGAGLDRIARADSNGNLVDDPRLKRIQDAIDVLGSQGFDRAERIQMVFSDSYDSDWNK